MANNDVCNLTYDYFNNLEQYGLSKRQGQFNMVKSIINAFYERKNLVIEAGVGIGKSYAYLVPLLYSINNAKMSFIISTSTIALQDQLENDLKTLCNQLKLPLNYVIAKGKNNFLCLNKLDDEIINAHNIDINKQDKKYYPDINKEDWENIFVDECSYGKCKNCEKCEFYKMRNQMRNINGIVICNHDLLLAELKGNIDFYDPKQMISTPYFIICDEAHKLESKIVNLYTKNISFKEISDTIINTINSLNEDRKESYKVKTIENYLNIIEKLIEKSIFETIKVQDNIDDTKIRITFNENNEKLLKKIQNLSKVVSKLDLDASCDYVNSEELKTINKIFKDLSKGNDCENLYWIDREQKEFSFNYIPKNINEKAKNLLFDSGKRYIFTSATLSTGDNDYSYFIKNIGADKINNIVVGKSQKSPFDYDNNALMYFCDDIESPRGNKDKYLDELVDKIKELIRLTKGKALILFTSKNDMKYVYNKIGDKLDDINIYVQSDGSSQEKVKEQFKNDINSVLLSTGIFWEGINIKGESLSNLIIARLPFPVVDPIIENKKEQYNDNSVYISEMLITLKQGVGRLIRDENDKGIVCILDSRVKNYEKVIRDTLPIKNITHNIDDVNDFVNQKSLKLEKSS